MFFKPRFGIRAQSCGLSWMSALARRRTRTRIRHRAVDDQNSRSLFLRRMSSPLAAVVLCAGKGTRMKSEKAKVLHAILGRPLCAYPLKRALELGASPLVPVVGHQAAEVEKAIRAQLPAGLAALRAPERAARHRGRGALGGERPEGLLGPRPHPLRRCAAAAPRDAGGAGGRARGGQGPALAGAPRCWRIPRATAASSARVARWRASSSTRTAPRSSARCASATPASTWWSPRSSGRRWRRSSPQNAQGEYYLTDLVEMAAQAGAGGLGGGGRHGDRGGE